jgi:hypothetical protein
LSSATTFWLKFVFPWIWIFLAAWLAGIVFILWICADLKRVRMDQDTLYISNFRREIAVPLSEIDSVAENRWINIHPVAIVFRHPTELGGRITFMPTVRMFELTWAPHPVVAQLRMAAYMKRFREGEIEKSQWRSRVRLRRRLSGRCRFHPDTEKKISRFAIGSFLAQTTEANALAAFDAGGDFDYDLRAVVNLEGSRTTG